MVDNGVPDLEDGSNEFFWEATGTYILLRFLSVWFPAVYEITKEMERLYRPFSGVSQDTFADSRCCASPMCSKATKKALVVFGHEKISVHSFAPFHAVC